MKNNRIYALILGLALAVSPGGRAEEVLTGERVLAMEQALYALGYHDEHCNAQLDEATRKALKSYQLANQLEPTGEPDAATLALLDSGESVTCHEYLMGLAAQYAEMPILQSGSSGEAVSALQNRLKELGYFSVQCDGVFGDATSSAVRRFQRANGLEETGIADRSTQMRLNEGVPIRWEDFITAACACDGDSGVYVQLLQQTLADLGYFHGECTGTYGDQTHQAVARFQASNQLEETGVADSATCEALYSDQAAAYRDERTLCLGDDDQQVADLQSRLAALGYFEKSITGIFGETTETAVRLFQMANGLPATGEAGPETLDKLDAPDVAALDAMRETFRAQVQAQDDTARAVVGSVALNARGRAFKADDEDLYEGFAFVQYVCVSAGIPVVVADDIVGLIDEKVEDLSAPQPGDILAIQKEGEGGTHLMLAVAAGDGRAIYATPASGWVLESYLRDMEGTAIYRWNMGESTQ